MYAIRSYYAARVEKLQMVESVHYRKQLLQLIDRRARAFGYAAGFIGMILALSAIILVANTIRLTIYAKRHIIRTMKLVGATSMLIRLPFLIEGAFHGIIGGVIASLLIDIRITSYNVCYTKLLRKGISITVRHSGRYRPAADTRSQFQVEVESTNAALKAALQTLTVKHREILELVFRITSYNVCYTKLLRHSLEESAWFLPDGGSRADRLGES